VRVILRTDVEKLGRSGEAVEVAAGYARNYLLPQKLAYPATPENERRIVKEKKVGETKRAQTAAAAQELVSRLSGLSVTVQAKTEGETLYGSIGAAEIVAALEREHGLNVPAEAVHLAEPIKKVGTHEVTFRVAEGVETVVKVWVLPEEPDPGTAGSKGAPVA
jgi:large subunit ribosomal protein L9